MKYLLPVMGAALVFEFESEWMEIVDDGFVAAMPLVGDHPGSFKLIVAGVVFVLLMIAAWKRS